MTGEHVLRPDAGWNEIRGASVWGKECGRIVGKKKKGCCPAPEFPKERKVNSR